MIDLLIKPFPEWNVHDWLYAEITDYKCFDGLALGKEFFRKFLYWSRMYYAKRK